MKGNGSALLSETQYIKNTLPRSAVSCNDNIPQQTAPTAEEVVDEFLNTLKHVTRFGVAIVMTEPDAGCQFWPVTPPERFNGPWNHTLSYPILIHSNLVSVLSRKRCRRDFSWISFSQLDPVTPLSNGRASKALLGDSSRLVLRDGPGVSSHHLRPSLAFRFNDFFCSIVPYPFPLFV